MAVPVDATRVEIIPAGSASVPQADRLALAFLSSYRQPTRDQYRFSMRSWFAHCADSGVDPITGVRRHDIELWARLLEERRGNKPATVSIRLSAVRSFYSWLEREELSERNPGRYVAMPKVSDESTTIGLSRLQLAALLEAAAPKPSYYALVCLLAFNGLRISEALGTDIEGLARVRGHRLLTVKGKGGKITSEPLAPETYWAIEQATAGRDSGPVILGATGARMSRSGAYKVFRRFGEKLGLPFYLHPHQLRHAFVTHGLDAGVTLRDMQTSARHVNANTTIRYDRTRGRLDNHATYRVTQYMLG